MKLSNYAAPLLFLIGTTNAFRSSPDGNDIHDPMSRAIEEALLVEKKVVSPLDDTENFLEKVEELCSYNTEQPPLRNQLLGTEEPCLLEYWQRPDIHTLGNVGFGGGLHAAMAPIATKVNWCLMLQCLAVSL